MKTSLKPMCVHCRVKWRKKKLRIICRNGKHKRVQK